MKKIIIILLYFSDNHANLNKNQKKLIEEFKSAQNSLMYIPKSFLNFYETQSIVTTILFLQETKSFESIPASDLLIYKNTLQKIKLIPKHYRKFKKEELKLHEAYNDTLKKQLALLKDLYSTLTNIDYTIKEESLNFQLLMKEEQNSKKFTELKASYNKNSGITENSLEEFNYFTAYISDQSDNDDHDDRFTKFNISSTGMSRKHVTFNLEQPYCDKDPEGLDRLINNSYRVKS